MTDLTFCLSEDRIDCEAGLRLAVLSLCTHCPGSSIHIYRHGPTDDFRLWLSQFPNIVLHECRPRNASQWNCKPQALLPLLESGCPQVVWLDSDVIVTRDCRPLFGELGKDVIVATQEPANQPYQGSAVRTLGWGLKVGRNIPITLNSSVLRFTTQHISLLRRYAELLSYPEYVAVQQLALAERPIHMMGDQDVFNALAGCADFCEFPLNILMSGSDIIHCGGALGYSFRERLAGLTHRLPTFLHATAGKPWFLLSDDPVWKQPGLFGWYRRLLQELSPYVAESRQYRSRLGQESRWMDKRSLAGVCFKALGFGHFALRGLPVTVAASIIQASAVLRLRNQPNRLNA
jgi:hypothetical protein